MVDPELPKEKYFRLHAVCHKTDKTLTFSTADTFATSYANGFISSDDWENKQLGCEAWEPEDFLGEEEFCQAMTWDTRKISFKELCDSADKFVGNQVSAYLETQLFSLELQSPEEVEELLRERFKQAKALAISTFQLAYDLDTFRIDFEGVQTNWAADLPHYLDRFHKNDVLARLDAHMKYYDATLLNAFREYIPDNPVPGEWWEESLAQLYGVEVLNDEAWFPLVTPFHSPVLHLLPRRPRMLFIPLGSLFSTSCN